jgi:peptide deformylase
MITLLNPRVIEESEASDEQYEGCWSFFDQRGKVVRPLVMHVEHYDIDGTCRISCFERGDTRLAAHEIDHINGVLYINRLAPEAELIPITKYGGTGSAWTYTSLEQ